MTGVRIHKLIECPYCGKQYSVTYLPYHVRRKHAKHLR